MNRLVMILMALSIDRRTFYRKSDISKICDEFSLFPDCPEFLEVPELCKEYEAKKELNGGAAPPSDDVVSSLLMKNVDLDPLFLRLGP